MIKYGSGAQSDLVIHYRTRKFEPVLLVNRWFAKAGTGRYCIIVLDHAAVNISTGAMGNGVLVYY
jgi:hypothetical protein